MAARAEIAVTHTSIMGVPQPAQTSGVAADGHKFRNDGNVQIEVENVHATIARVITFQTPGKVLGMLEVAEHAVSVAALATVLIGPFSVKAFNQTDGMVYIDYPVADFADLKIRLTEVA